MLKVPDYTDDEVKVFHPIFKSCVENLLIDNKSLFKAYECIHHKKLKSGKVPDFIIRNRNTKEIILICEIKRTISDVYNFNFNEQVRSYADELADDFERPFYLITNLEVINFYKYKTKDDKTLHHLLDISPINCLRFNQEDIDSLKSKFTENLKKIFELIFFEKEFKWKLGLSKLDNLLSGEYPDFNRWMKIASIYLQYYVKGSILERGLKPKKNTTLNFYRKLTQEKYQIDTDLSKSSFEAGRTYLNGDDFAHIVQSQVIDNLDKNDSGPNTPTDNEVCKLVSAIIKENFKSEVRKKRFLDPGCGIGNLLVNIMSELNVPSKNIFANDINPFFCEASRLRLSLFSNQDSNYKSNVFNENIINLNEKIFESVDCLVMNPPFKRGANYENASEKNILKKNIKKISKKNSQLGVKASGIEALHLEYLCLSLKKNTLFITVFPLRYLKTASESSSALREFLLTKFGLTDIIFYPHQDIFSDVKKSTVLLVGKVGFSTQNINVVDINNNLDQVNLHSYEAIKKDKKTNFKEIKVDEFKESIEDGWSNLLGTEISFIDNSKIKFNRITELAKFLARGNADNKGGSEIVFPSKDNKIGKQIYDSLGNSSLMLGVKRAINLPQSISNRNLEVRAINPKKFDEFKRNKKFESILNSLNIQVSESKAQYKKSKSFNEILKNIQTTRIYDSKTILLPRGIRKNSVVSVLEEEAVLSTNFIPIKMKNIEHTNLAVSFLSSIFGQMQFEVLSNNERGLRKCEQKSCMKLFLPNFDEICHQDKKQILQNFKEKSHYSRDLYNFTIDDRDLIWSKIVFYHKPEDKLKALLKEFKILVLKRSS